VIESTHSRGHWSAPARFDHGFHNCARASKYCLDRTIATITHPTTQPAPARLLLDKGTIADALDLAAHNDVANDIAAHASSPASTTRAPVQRRFIEDRCVLEPYAK
jgi:hypothetical protein